MRNSILKQITEWRNQAVWFSRTNRIFHWTVRLAKRYGLRRLERIPYFQVPRKIFSEHLFKMLQLFNSIWGWIIMLIVSMCFERYNVFKRPGMIVNLSHPIGWKLFSGNQTQRKNAAKNGGKWTWGFNWELLAPEEWADFITETLPKLKGFRW